MNALIYMLSVLAGVLGLLSLIAALISAMFLYPELLAYTAFLASFFWLLQLLFGERSHG